MADPAFWQDQDLARKTGQRRSQLKDPLDRAQAIEDEIEEIEILIELAEEEDDAETAEEVKRRLDKLGRKMEAEEMARLLSGENDHGGAIVSINSGAGGTEANDWSEMLLRLYTRYAERQGYKIEVLDISPGDEAGIKSCTFTVDGPNAYGFLRAEVGIHRLVRISPFDSSARRHTSFASVFVYPQIEDDIDVEIEEKDIRIDTYRASGAGGQHVNKTESAVRITHFPTGIVVQCQNEKSQHRNRDTAMKVLKSRVYEWEVRRRQEEMDKVNAEKKEIAWGSQIRSYVLQPYRLVKDHRTNFEMGNVDAVLDGDIDRFIRAYLVQRAAESARAGGAEAA